MEISPDHNRQLKGEDILINNGHRFQGLQELSPTEGLIWNKVHLNRNSSSQILGIIPV